MAEQRLSVAAQEAAERIAARWEAQGDLLDIEIGGKVTGDNDEEIYTTFGLGDFDLSIDVAKELARNGFVRLIPTKGGWKVKPLSPLKKL